MNILDKTVRYISDKDYRFIVKASRGFCNSMSDEEYLKRMFKYRMGRELNLSNPQSYNEKLQWLKLHDRNPIYTTMVDKYAVKKYVSDIIGEKYVVPAYGVWDRFDDIDFDKLPDQFVIKCTHDSGGLVICKDKKSFDKEEAKAKIEASLKKNFFYYAREWPYKNVQPRIIVEKYLTDSASGELMDYKFFTFDGVAKALFIASERQDNTVETKFDFFDMNFTHLDIINGHPNSTRKINKPKAFDEMRELSEKLSKGIPHVRVDFYEADGHVFFGEFTFSHWSGLVPFVPEKWDYTFGSWIKLPEIGPNHYSQEGEHKYGTEMG